MGTEQSIVQAALEVLSASSIDKLTVRDIAARAGVNVATVHYYFRTKQGIVAAALQEFFAPILQTLGHTLALELPAREKLLRFLMAYTDHFHAHPGVFNSMIGAITVASLYGPPTKPDVAQQVLLDVVAGAKTHLMGLVREISGIEDEHELVLTALRTMTSVLHPLLLSHLPLTVFGVDFSDRSTRCRYLEAVVASLDSRPT